MTTDLRISADQAWRRIRSGRGILVCAYDDDRCQKFMFEGALSLKQFEERRGSFPEATDILFYCACPNEATSARRAEQYRTRGYKNAYAVAGGVEALERLGLRRVSVEAA